MGLPHDLFKNRTITELGAEWLLGNDTEKGIGGGIPSIGRPETARTCKRPMGLVQNWGSGGNSGWRE